MTFDELLEALNEFEFDYTEYQVSILAERVETQWGLVAVMVLHAAISCSGNQDNFYIPDTYDCFTIASLIAGIN